MNAIRRFGSWCKGVLSEPDGTGSSSRVAFLMLIATCCLSIISCTFVLLYLVLLFKKIPEGMEHMVSLIGALTGLSAAGAAAYASNKFSAGGIFGALKDKLTGKQDTDR